MSISLTHYLHYGMLVCVRAVCESGTMTTVCQEPKLLSHPNDFDKTVLYEMNSELFHHNKIDSLISSKSIGSKLTLVHKSEADFVLPSTPLAGVILGENERRITWYLMKKPHCPIVTCDDDLECIKTVESSGGLGFLHKTHLHKNTKYYICAFSNKTVVKREYFSETLEEIDTCGNGFVVDSDPPIAGQVTLVSNSHVFLTSNKSVRVVWDKFRDIEKFRKTEYQTGIASYHVSLGKYSKHIPNKIKDL